MTHIGSKRRDEADSTVFANLATDAGVALDIADGSIANAWFGKGGGHMPGHRGTMERTDATETIAGEKCVVWRAMPKEMLGTAYVPYTSCSTGDGIVLRETDLYGDGRMLHDRQAVMVARRPVASAEVLPPADVLRWVRWEARIGASADGGAAAGNHEVALTRQPSGGAMTILRAGMAGRGEESRSGERITGFEIAAAGLALSYHDHRQPQMSLRTGTTVDQWDSRDSRPVRSKVSGETMLGERCEWVHPGPLLADMGLMECWTTDRISLTR